MRKYIKSCLLLFTALLGLAPLSGEIKQLTLNDVLSMGYDNNVSLQIENINLKGKEREMKSVYNFLYPDISSGISISRSNTTQSGSVLMPVGSSAISPGVYNEVSVTDYEISKTSLMASVSGSLVLNAAMFDGIESTRLDYRAGLLSRSELEKRTKRDLSKNFYSLLVLQENIGILQSSLETSKKRYEQTNIDYLNGRVAELSLLNTRVAYENMIPYVKQLEDNFENLMNMLKVSIGIDVDREKILSGTIHIPSFNSSSVSIDPQSRFDIRSLDLSIRQLEVGKRAQKNYSFTPTLILSAGTTPILIDPFSSDSWDDSWSDQWTDQGSLSLMLSFDLDSLLPGSAARNDIQEIEDQIKTLKLQSQQLKESGKVEIMNSLNAIESSKANIESLKLTTEVALRNLELTEEAYKAGTKELLDVQTAEDELRQADLNLLSEKNNYLSSLFDLEYQLNINILDLN